MKKWLIPMLCALFTALAVPCALADSDVTVMVYMAAADLESDDGAATADINEMMYADTGGSVNVILCAGGTTEWQNTVMNADTNEYYRIHDSRLELIKDAGCQNMASPDTLAEFITFCAENYPAGRYVLVLWDHGGGSLYGFGMDERFSDEDLMPLSQLGDALETADVRFEIIGFDACLMGTIETAMTVAPYADYLIASEETEPATGWYYTDWLSALSANPAMEAEALGRAIIDDFMTASLKEDSRDTLTLSMIDLNRLQDSVLSVLWDFSSDAASLIDNGQFGAVSRARSGARSYGSDDYDQIDLIDFASGIGTDAAQALIDAVNDAVVYNRATRNMSGSSGLAIYFPYDWLDELDSMLVAYDELNWDESYIDLIERFANLQAGGQSLTGAAFDLGTLWASLFSGIHAQDGAGTDYSAYGWFSADYIVDQSDYITNNQLAEDELTVDLKNDEYYALSLSDEAWNLISDIQLQVYMDDGEGYIELGSDDVFDFDEDGDLIVDFDYTWVTLDGCTVAYYAEDYVEDGDYFCYTGYVPVALNGEEAELVLCWDSEHDEGYVRGARHPFSSSALYSRGLIELNDGDVVEPLCSYYTYDGDYDGVYYFGDGFTVSGPVRVSYDDIGDYDTMFTYELIDIYSNSYWTEMLCYQ